VPPRSRAELRAIPPFAPPLRTTPLASPGIAAPCFSTGCHDTGVLDAMSDALPPRLRHRMAATRVRGPAPGCGVDSPAELRDGAGWRAGRRKQPTNGAAPNGIRAADPVTLATAARPLPGAGNEDADRAEAVLTALRYRK